MGKFFIITSILFFTYSCSVNKKSLEVSPSNTSSKILFGKVKEIKNEKDGYTAQIVDKKGEIYSAVISIPNMDNPQNFKTFKIKNDVSVIGDVWKLGNENHVTVREIFSEDNNNFTVTGIVQSINHGGDGYTAKIRSLTDKILFVTISIPNLGKNHEKFKEYKIGESITVNGELWNMNEELHVTVRNIIY